MKKTGLLVHVRARKYHPQTIGREERYHGSLKLEHLYRVLPNNRTELIEAVSSYRQFYNYERLHMSLGYRTPAAVYLNKPETVTYQPEKVVPKSWDRTVERYSRFRCTEIITKTSTKDFVIVFDDSERRGEQETIKYVTYLLDRKKVTYKLNAFAGRATQTVITAGRYGHVSYYY